MVSRGIIRPTADVDVCYEVSRENSVRLVHALQDLHPRLRTDESEEAQLLARMFRFDARTLRMGQNLTLMTDAGALDLLAYVDGLGTYAVVRAAASTIDLYGLQVAVLDLPGLLRAKRAAGREKDLLVIPEIEALIHLRNLEPKSRQADEGLHGQ